MKKLLVAAAIAAALISPARADYLIKDGGAAPQTIKAGDLGTGSLGGREILPYSSPSDASGTPYSIVNPLAVQFGTGITLPSFATPQHFICDSGCAGGGGSSYTVTYGAAIGTLGTPNGYKDGSGNFQPILGDTTNGQWVSIKASVPIAVTGTFFQATQPVSIASSVAVTGPLTDTQLRATAVPVTLTSTTITGNVAVTGTFWQATQPISAASLPLPTGAATQTTLASLLTALGTPFQAGGSIGNTSFGISGTLPAFAATPTVNLGTIGTAATAANQTTGNSSLSSIDGKTPALGQALAGASVPVVLTAAQITTLTPLSSVTVTQGTGTNLHVVCDSGCSSSSSPTFGAAFPTTGTPIGMTQGGNLVALSGTSGNLNVQCANCSGSGVSTADAAAFTAGASLFAGGGGFFQTTATANPLTTGQQGMFQVTANRALFTNLRTAAGVEIGVAAAPVQVSLANTAANATAIKVDGSAVTQPVSGTVAFSNSTIAVTQATAASLNATVVGTGTFAVQAAQSGTWNVTNISGTVSLPTGAATSALQPTNAAIASTTAGQTGHLMMGAVTTAAPSYTTAQSNPLSLTTAGALRVDGSAVTQPVSLTSTTITGTVAVTQSGSWSLAANQSVNNAQINGVAPLMGNGVTGTGSQRVTIASDNTAFSVNAIQSGTWNVGSITTLPALVGGSAIIGKVGIDQTTPGTTNLVSIGTNGTVNPTTAANWGIGTATQNSASVANGHMMLAQFNTTPTTITTGNMSPLQMDSAGNLLVNIKAGASSGAVAQGSTTSGQTGGLTQAAATSAAPTYTTATTNPLSMDLSGNLRVSVSNTNGNGQTTMSASSPVVIASDQSAVAIKAASASIASGAIASGAVASGAIASGAYAAGSIGAGAVAAGSYVSGSILSGALASGAVVDITNMSGTTAAAVPSKAVLSGARSGANIVELIQASASAAINVSTATTTQLVALSGSTKIYVTALDVIAAGTGNITFVYGTGASCATGTTPLTGAYNLTAQAGLAKGGGLGPVLVVPAGNALCVTTTAAVQMSGSVAYTQF